MAAISTSMHSRASVRLGPIIIHDVPVEKIIPLRHRILLQGRPIEAAKFQGDTDPMTRHFATFRATPDGNSIGEPLCCASFVWNEFNGEPAWRLRGMATDTPYQGHGLGGRLLRWFEETVIGHGSSRLMWCTARVSAVRFYASNGWTCVSQEFDIPAVGPHRKMIKRV